MSATTRTAPETHARHAATPAGSPWTGTRQLFGFALRRDRLRLTVWLAVLTALVGYTPGALELAYPEEEQRWARVELLKTPAGTLMSGPVFGVNETALGTMLANELMLTLIVAASILAVLTVIRHTRAAEEDGSAELVLASVVGRHARTTAALTLAGAVNTTLAVTMTAALAATGLDVMNSAAMCVGVAAVAMVFAAVAAVTAQLWRTARAATGAALAVLALAVLVRGLGDVIDHSGSTLSWFSPIAWAQQMRAFVDVRWWPLVALIALAVGLVIVAGNLEQRRQYDDGTIASTGDRPHARPVGGVFGLHLVLQRGQMVGWSVGLFGAGLAFGSMTQSLLDAAVDNELIARMLNAEGTDGVHTAMSQFLAAAASAYAVATVLRVYADERCGLGEAVLARPVSRWRWLSTAVAASVLGSTVLMACAGLGNGLGAGLTVGAADTVLRLTGAGLAFVPALAVLAGVAAVAVALRQPWIGWLAVTFVVTSLYLAALLRLPQWLVDLSPVGRITAPQQLSAGTLMVMAALAVALTALAGFVYRHRDAA
ncbi:ABC transporter permease [Mycolicibacterium duvalii]|uniref:ABC transporter n=1 Tax=Mycolicibacterium duvalii TaxID=39688 RepID=A0A7I7JVD5_9MYCO|nr:ABC transporter [Mycolicibacterium duvalii]MCV7368658.1 ABC transporter [Mycolicibacterium duvalii]BBX15358.1 ABC transporter [Mycolicibacterium duvalii]